jgi:hypothetical protein
MTTTMSHVPTNKPAFSVERSYRSVAVACATVAGLVHVLVIPEHLRESWLVGAFFAEVAAAQLVLAWMLRRTTGVATLLVGIWATLGLVALYVASRTMELAFLPAHAESAHQVNHLPVAWGVGNGTPIFPHSHIEPVGVPDLVCLVAELGLVVVLVGLLPAKARRHTTTAMLLGGAAALALRVSGLMT